MEFLRRKLRGESLQGKVALLTGAGGGIGTLIAVALAAEGCNLCLSDRDPAALASVRDAATLRGGNAVRVVCVLADLRRPEDVNKLAKACEDAYHRCDYLLNVAGHISVVDVATEAPDEAADILQVNLQAPMLLTRAILPGMLARRSGVIVNMTSVLGFVATPRFAAYSASKAGLNVWTTALRAELRGSGVRVCAVSPLFVTATATGTGMYESMLQGPRGGLGSKAAADVAHQPLRVPMLHPWLWEVKAAAVTCHVIAALRRGAPRAFAGPALLMQRAINVAQALAPDWVTAWVSSALCPGDAFFMARGKLPLAAAARNEE